MAKTIKINAVFGVKDNGELVNIIVEGSSYEMTHILMTIWGKKLNRNIIRQISSGEFTESIEQEIIKSAQCECGGYITLKAFCLENSASSDTWKGELQCFEIGKEAAAIVAEGFEAEEAEEEEEVKEVVEAEEAEEEKEEEEEEAGLPEPLPLETLVLEKEEETAVIVAEGLKAEEALKTEETEEETEEEEEAELPESLPLEIPVPEKEEEPAVTVAEGFEVKEDKESVPKSFLFPTIEITTVKGFAYKGNLVDIVVEGNSTVDKRILIKIQWGNIKYYKIVNPSPSGEFKSSFEQDISRSAQSKGGDQITVTALSLANSGIFDIWKEKLPCVEKIGEPIR
jgi:hypothetical protein